MDNQTKAERTKKFIIERSASLINKQGMAGTSISDIMAVTKLAKGGIYGNFESKDAICLASFSYLAAAIAQELDHAVKSGATAKEKLTNLLNFYMTERAMEGGCPLLNFGVESDDTHPQINACVQAAIVNAQKRIAGIVKYGIAQKEISAELNPKAFSIKTFALIEGGILCRKVLGQDEQMILIIDSIKKEFDEYHR